MQKKASNRAAVGGMSIKGKEREYSDGDAKVYRPFDVAFQYMISSGMLRQADHFQLPIFLFACRRGAGEMEMIEAMRSSDGGYKYLLSDNDPAKTVEATFFEYGDKRLPCLCVSSQFGCAVGCLFCETGRQKLMGNLDEAQIVEQVQHCLLDRRSKILGFEKLNTVLFAGMGEPMHNLSAVGRAARHIKESGMAERVTLTTIGVLSKFDELDAIPLDSVSISLHATTDDVRGKLMPGAEKYRIEDVMECARRYRERTGTIVTFNYLLLRGVNDTDDDLHRLTKLATPGQFAIRLKYLNDVSPIDGMRLTASDRFSIFFEKLTGMGFDCEIDESQCIDVWGGCGQLRSRARTIRPIPAKVSTYWAIREAGSADR